MEPFIYSTLAHISLQKVIKMLKELNLQEYQAIFHSKNIDGSRLASMTRDDLKLLGIPLNQQDRILDVINGHISAQLLVCS